MNSVFQSKEEKECFLCHTTRNIHDHHIFMGTANRVMSEQYGMKVWLCQEHHTGNTGVHFNRELDLKLKKMGQEYFEDHYGSREVFIKTFGRNYLY